MPDDHSTPPALHHDWEGIDDDPDLEERRPVAWTPLELASLPRSLPEAAVCRAEEWAVAHRAGLDVTGFAPAAAARASGGYEHLGVEVLGWHAMRLVGPVRYAGEEALLVADVTAVEHEDLEALVERAEVRLRVVPRTGVAEAARVALQDEPGFPLT